MERITSNHLGLELYPVDNSYSQDLTTGKRPDIGNGIALAGNINTLAVKVKIVSEPFVLTLGNEYSTGELSAHEFVIVEYNSKKYIILNNFTKEPWPLDIEA